MKILLDTNILVHAHNAASPYNEKAADVIRGAIRRGFEACMADQNLYEFFAVVTNPKRVERPLSIDEAVEICLDLWRCKEIEKIFPPVGTPGETLRIAGGMKLSRTEIFDCLLAVTARGNGVDTIYTENVDHFKAYGFLKVENPLV